MVDPVVGGRHGMGDVARQRPALRVCVATVGHVTGPASPSKSLLRLAGTYRLGRQPSRVGNAVWPEHRGLVALIATYVLASALAGPLMGWRPPSDELLGFVSSLVCPLIYATLYLFALRRRAEQGGVAGVGPAWAAAWQTARRGAWTGERLAGAAIVLGLFPLFAASFTAWKLSIPIVHPFEWDARLAAADRWLLGGHDAWELTHVLFGGQWATRLLDVLYLPAWAAQQSLVLTAAAFAAPGAFRRRFLSSYFLTWAVAGTLLAIGFASVGPIFVGRIAGTAEDAAVYAPLAAKLTALHATYPLFSVRGQEILAAIATGRLQIAGGGVSAMPSLHVATAVLIAVAARHVSRTWAGVTTAYAVVVVVGSVHFGWHYALDSIVGAAVALVIWQLTRNRLEPDARWRAPIDRRRLPSISRAA